jgi:hypothetical protein
MIPLLAATNASAEGGFVKRNRLLILILVTLATLVAYPCSFIIIPHEIDPNEQQLDNFAPSPPHMSLMSVQRGLGPGPDGSGSSCNDIGEIILKLDEVAQDDRTPPDKMGYLWQVKDGQPPSELEPLPRPVRLSVDGLLSVWWVDGATHEQEPLEFSVTVTAFDLAGNPSQPSASIQIRHPGNK